MAHSTYTFRLAENKDKQEIINFMNTHWGEKHPLVNIPEFFSYYYENSNGRLNFAIAEKNGKTAALAGFIYSSDKKENADIWLSLWIANKNDKGSGLELMEQIPRLTSCRVLSCNNIRPETRVFYEFLSYKTGRMGHFYRLGYTENFKIAKINKPLRLPVSGSAKAVLYKNSDELESSGFAPAKNAVPYKDLAYIKKRYFNYPLQAYNLYGLINSGETVPFALLAVRIIPCNNTFVLRITDFIGPCNLLPMAGNAIDKLIIETNAEYADFYCAGIPADIFEKTGFCERKENGSDIVPNYLTPPLYENTDFYYFTNQNENFTMFKADGDQDRPNIILN